MLSTLYRFVSLPRSETTVKYHKGLSVLMRQILLLAVESPLTARDSSSRGQGGALFMDAGDSVRERQVQKLIRTLEFCPLWVGFCFVFFLPLFSLSFVKAIY